MRTKYKKICAVCGHVFSTMRQAQITCTSECGRIQAHISRRKYYDCQYCGKPFWRKNAFRMKYCSVECQNAALHEQVLERHKNDVPKILTTYDHVCPECETEFTTVYPNHIYCCNECAYEANKKQHRERWADEYTPRSFFCKECSTKVVTSCGNTRSSFCSLECQEKFTDRLGKERRSQQMKIAFRQPVSFKKIFERDEGVCKICGLLVAYDKTPECLWAATIDHVVPLSIGGTHEPDNCQLAHRLCNSLKLQEDDSFYIDWDEMCKVNKERWVPAIEEYTQYMNRRAAP